MSGLIDRRLRVCLIVFLAGHLEAGELGCKVLFGLFSVDGGAVGRLDLEGPVVSHCAVLFHVFDLSF